MYQSINLVLWVTSEVAAHEWMSMSTCGGRAKCLHESTPGDPWHRPLDVVETARARVPSLGPHGQTVPDCACHFCVSWETIQQFGARKEWLCGVTFWTLPWLTPVMWSKQAPWTQLETEKEEWHTHTHRDIHTVTYHWVTDTHLSLSLTSTNI